MTRAVALFVVALFSTAGVHAQALEGRLKKIAETKAIAIAYRADALPFSFTNDTTTTRTTAISTEPMAPTDAASVGVNQPTMMPNSTMPTSPTMSIIPVSERQRSDHGARARAGPSAGFRLQTIQTTIR